MDTRLWRWNIGDRCLLKTDENGGVVRAIITRTEDHQGYMHVAMGGWEYRVPSSFLLRPTDDRRVLTVVSPSDSVLTNLKRAERLLARLMYPRNLLDALACAVLEDDRAAALALADSVKDWLDNNA